MTRPAFEELVRAAAAEITFRRAEQHERILRNVVDRGGGCRSVRIDDSVYLIHARRWYRRRCYCGGDR